RENVRMLQPGGHPDLQQEALGAQARGESGLEDLERDGAVMPQVVSEVDSGHAAAAELALDVVAVAERGVRRWKGIGRGHLQTALQRTLRCPGIRISSELGRRGSAVAPGGSGASLGDLRFA